MKKYLLLLVLLCTLPTASFAQESLPAVVTQQIGQPLKTVGSGVYTKLGFTVYRATLWTPSGQWKPAEPYALQLRYAMSLSKQTIVEAVAGDIRRQNVTDADTMDQWEERLNQTLPAVYNGDVIVGLALPGKASTLYFNGKPITTITDKTFSDAFFDIWLGQTADTKLKSKLLGI